MTTRFVRAFAPAFVFAALALGVPSVRAETGCEADLQAVADAIAKKADLSESDKQQLEDMQAQAGALCDSGNADEGKNVLAEAKALLGIDK